MFFLFVFELSPGRPGSLAGIFHGFPRGLLKRIPNITPRKIPTKSNKEAICVDSYEHVLAMIPHGNPSEIPKGAPTRHAKWIPG